MVIEPLKSVFFGRSSCKETRAVAEIIQLSESDSDERDEETSMDVDERYEETSMDVDEETEIDGVVIEENSSEEITTPSFVTTPKNRIYELCIPDAVVKRYKLRFGESIKYIDEEGTLRGQRVKWADNRIGFKGWDRICRSNRLKKDKYFVKCELLHNQRHVHSIRVHVVLRDRAD